MLLIFVSNDLASETRRGPSRISDADPNMTMSLNDWCLPVAYIQDFFWVIAGRVVCRYVMSDIDQSEKFSNKHSGFPINSGNLVLYTAPCKLHSITEKLSETDLVRAGGVVWRPDKR
jgi:hypothetical protein